MQEFEKCLDQTEPLPYSTIKGILKKDEEGNLRPDYSKHRSRYRTEYQQDEDQRRERAEKLRDNARRLREMKDEVYSDRAGEPAPDEEEGRDFDEGVAKIRRGMMDHVRDNRNHKKYKSEDFE